MNLADITPMQRALLRQQALSESQYNHTVRVALPSNEEPRRWTLGRLPPIGIELRTVELRLSRWICQRCQFDFIWASFEDEPQALCPKCDALDPIWLYEVFKHIGLILNRAMPTIQRRLANIRHNVEFFEWGVAEKECARARLSYQHKKPGGNARDRRKVLRPARKVLAAEFAAIEAKRAAAVAAAFKSGGLQIKWNP